MVLSGKVVGLGTSLRNLPPRYDVPIKMIVQKKKTITETNTLPVALIWRPGFLASSHTFDITHRKSKRSASLIFFAVFTVE